MNILIVGNGGREHALAWKVKQSPLTTQVFVAPGNGGTALESGVKNIPISAHDIDGLLNFALENKIDLTLPGSETALAAGIVDTFQAHQLRCFGPTQAAAQLESSKAFSKAFMQAAGIPTAHYECFTDFTAAADYLRTQKRYPLVIKADGLAAGKGVVIVSNETEALHTVKSMLSGDILNGAGKQIVIEDFITGEEASFIVIADGKHAIALATSQDHKARDDGDMGPNTGGMGACSPAPVLTSALQAEVMQTVIYPTLEALAAQGTPYTGFLYAGLMITPENTIKVLEFNCRLGDPETQPILMRLNSDLVHTCLIALEKKLDTIKLDWDSRSAVGVVMACQGYPEAYEQGKIIHGLPNADGTAKVFHAGTELENDHIKTSGGRVLCVTTLGTTLKDAQIKAYELTDRIQWENKYYRTDIAHKAIARE